MMRDVTRPIVNNIMNLMDERDKRDQCVTFYGVLPSARYHIGMINYILLVSRQGKGH